MNTRSRLLSMVSALTAGLPAVALAATCEAPAGRTPLQVLELYTSQGCSSCPPADRWLSSLVDKPGVLPLAFHVSYWNRLGWPDPFASPDTTRRQHEWARFLGAAQVYTPQLVASGKDWRQWPNLPPAPPPAPMALRLQVSAELAVAEVGAAAGPWTAYWALTEDGHRSRVTAGENEGRTLNNDHVVRLYAPVPAWSGRAQRFELPMPPATGPGRRIAFVVEDAQTRRPVQALSCR